MTDGRHPEDSLTKERLAASRGKRLDSWKEIGVFFGRDERTVKRWEASRGLPIHRVPGNGRANVYAYTGELEDWLGSAQKAATKASDTGTSQQAAGPSDREPIAEQAEPAAPLSSQAIPSTILDREPGTSSARFRYERSVVFIVTLAIALVGIFAYLQERNSHRIFAAGASNGKAVDSRAEQLYLQGLFYWQKRTPESLDKAVDSFTQAIVRDPGYAEAYVGLANCYNLLREYTLMSPEEAYPRALAAAQRAVELDGSLASAHSSLGFIDFFWLHNPQASEREFRLAIEIDPRLVEARQWYGSVLMHLGRFDEAIAQLEEAQKLQPASNSILADKALALFLSGKREEGIAILKQIEALEPSFLSPHNYLASFALVSGDSSTYLAESQKAADLLHDADRAAVVAAAESGYRRGGYPTMIEAILGEEKKLFEAGRLSPYQIAETAALAGKTQEALDYLEIARQKNDSHLAGLRIDLELHNLGNLPEYKRLLASSGFTDPQSPAE